MAAAIGTQDAPTQAPSKPAPKAAEPSDERPSYVIAIEKALASENPRAAVEKIASEYLNDFTNRVRCELAGQPNSPEVARFQMVRNAYAIGALGALMTADDPKLLSILAKAVRNVK
jgi:hypothetical protein